MLVIKRKPVQKGNSLIITIPQKEYKSGEVFILDEEAFDKLVRK